MKPQEVCARRKRRAAVRSTKEMIKKRRETFPPSIEQLLVVRETCGGDNSRLRHEIGQAREGQRIHIPDGIVGRVFPRQHTVRIQVAGGNRRGDVGCGTPAITTHRATTRGEGTIEIRAIWTGWDRRRLVVTSRTFRPTSRPPQLTLPPTESTGARLFSTRNPPRTRSSPCSALFSRALWLVRASKVYSAVGSRHCLWNHYTR